MCGNTTIVKYVSKIMWKNRDFPHQKHLLPDPARRTKFVRCRLTFISSYNDKNDFVSTLINL